MIDVKAVVQQHSRHLQSNPWSVTHTVYGSELMRNAKLAKGGPKLTFQHVSQVDSSQGYR